MKRNEIWNVLQHDAKRMSKSHLRELFAKDPERANRLSFSFDDVLIDFSKEKLDAKVLNTLLDLARISDVEEKRRALFAGEVVNTTEMRPALHMALRGGAQLPTGDDVVGVLNRFLDFAEDVRQSYWQSKTGSFTDVICLGIGGSDLGPAMAVNALVPDSNGPNMHFVSNVDGAHLTDIIANLDPTRTLVIVSSKTFTTEETMTNARSARNWLKSGVSNVNHHMAAVSTNIEECIDFGIDRSRIFEFWDWVGGRYSLWSSIGLPIAIAIGAEKFRDFLAGAAAMDKHFANTELHENLPVLFALIGVWRRNLMNTSAVALIPYDQRLQRLPAYLQQLDMESNGKRVCLNGSLTTISTSPVIFGEPGTNSQHSFFQMLHQGSDIIPVDFLVAANPRNAPDNHHQLLLANCLGQSQSLAFGKSEAKVREEMLLMGIDKATIDDLAPHRTFPGDRPSTTIVYRKLDPYSLGRLIALFEHKIFVQGVIWQINSYDQWGVELGKQCARAIVPALKGEEVDGLDASTKGLLNYIKELRP